jgi:hypothetical protein
MSLTNDLEGRDGQDDQTLKTQGSLALWPTHVRWLKFLGSAAVISTAVSEGQDRKLVAGLEMPDWAAGLVSYISFASGSMLLVGGVLAVMLWVNERNRTSRR